jgi:hypothetical protein
MTDGFQTFICSNVHTPGVGDLFTIIQHPLGQHAVNDLLAADAFLIKIAHPVGHVFHSGKQAGGSHIGKVQHTLF